ncbi:MAG TPA: methyl-accepting chemotaxis protein [Vicinamibacterales bacterium]|nr:methyl-accepting chemotaxis protein [Vicinamibacterales bacterium]
MRRILDGLRISQRLLLISAAFMLPLGVSLYVVVMNGNATIRFSQFELYGNEYQRPLEALLQGLSEHQQTASALASGDQAQKAGAGEAEQRVERAFDALEEVDRRLGETLQFTTAGLTQRKRQHVALSTVRNEWQDVKSSTATASSLASVIERHTHLAQDVRTMIAHAGDTSNLILDPDLDSYYTMDVTLLALPQTQDRISNIIAFAQALSAKNAVSDQDRVQMAVHAALLKESDVARIVADVDVALNEDTNFMGTSETLQKNLPPAVKSYVAAASALADALGRAAAGEVAATAVVAAGSTARDASFTVWKVAVDELDTLLQTRVDHYSSSRLWALGLCALASLCAQAVVFGIGRSITQPLTATSSELGTNAQQIVSAAGEVAASAQSLSHGATEQAAALEETSASMEEMASMTQRNAENSQAAASLMSQVDERVKESNGALAELVVSMASIQDASLQVAKIIKTIDDIAFQTNILALNAAVEAARAGEAGMGFAVVADEVRNLAQRSAQAAKDTAALIEASIDRAKRGNVRVEQVAGSISGITESVVTVKSLVDQVSVASREQAQGIEQVSQALAQMETITQTNAATAEESAASSEELNAQAEVLLSAVAQLRAMVDGVQRQETTMMASVPPTTAAYRNAA